MVKTSSYRDLEKVKVTVKKSGHGNARSKHEVLAYDRSIWQKVHGEPRYVHAVDESVQEEAED